MQEATSKNKKGNRIAVVVAVVLVIALLLAGTYAWTDFTQHDTNPFNGGEQVSVTLNDKYTPPDEWLAGQTVDKKVSVTNTDESNRLAYVRLQFKEYMESYKLVPVQESGENVLFATYADGAKKGEYMTWADAQAGGYDYTEYVVNGVSYARTRNEELRNGIYGKAMYIPDALDIYGTANKAQYVHEEQHTDECEYNVHNWDGSSIANRTDSSDKIADYISWTLGSQVVTMTNWISAGKPTGNFWILDEADGWVYWASALAPGESTSNILESVKLDVMPGANFEYYIHIDMEAVTLDELTRTDSEKKWTDASNGAKDLFAGYEVQPAPGWNNNGNNTATQWTVVGGNLVEGTDVIIIDQNRDFYRQAVLNVATPGGGSSVLPLDNVYEVLNDDLSSQSPKAYIYDFDGSLTANKESNGDEYYCDANGLIPVDTTNMDGDLLFPDSVLRDAILNGFTPGSYTQMPLIDTNSDGKLSKNEIDAVIMLNISGHASARQNFTDLTGIKIFQNLEELSFSYNDITEVDLSAFTKLKTLRFNYCLVTMLDTRNNPELVSISCYNNQITGLDVSNNTALTILYCYNNQITELDVSNNKALTLLYCNNNQLTELDVSTNTALTNLQCSGNQLTSLDVSTNTALTTLYCASNQITFLDISMLSFAYNSSTLRVNGNNMQSLIVPAYGSTFPNGNIASSKANWNNKTQTYNSSYRWAGNDSMTIYDPTEWAAVNP